MKSACVGVLSIIELKNALWNIETQYPVQKAVSRPHSIYETSEQSNVYIRTLFFFGLLYSLRRNSVLNLEIRQAIFISGQLHLIAWLTNIRKNFN